MSLRSVAKSLTGSLEDVLSVTSVISDGISVAKSYMSEVKEQQMLGKEARMIKFKDELDMDLAEFKTEYKAKMSNLAEEYKLLNTEEVNNNINLMLKDMGIKE
jgi:hypothetical protein